MTMTTTVILQLVGQKFTRVVFLEILDKYGHLPFGMKWGYWNRTLWILDNASIIHEVLVKELETSAEKDLFYFFGVNIFSHTRNIQQSGITGSIYIPVLEAYPKVNLRNVSQATSASNPRKASIYCEVTASESVQSIWRKCRDYIGNFDCDIVIGLKY